MGARRGSETERGPRQANLPRFVSLADPEGDGRAQESADEQQSW